MLRILCAKLVAFVSQNRIFFLFNIILLQKGVAVDLTKMDEISEYHPEDFTVSVQPGVTRLSLNEYLKGDGLWFPVG